MEPARFDEMRPGCFDIDARIADMDRAGIWASLCFPSLVSGFCGAVYSRAHGQGSRAGLPARLQRLAPRGVGGHATRSASSRCSCPGWPTSRWPRPRCGPTPPAASRRSASPSSPPSCSCPPSSAATGTPSSPPARRPAPSCACTPAPRRWAPLPSPDPPFELLPTVFPVNALLAAGEWLWSGVPLRFPGPAGRAVRGRHRLGARC